MWRVGYRPEPWAWSSWQYTSNGRFTDCWDDADGSFRTIYAGSRLLSCLLEVLACLRPDPHLAAHLTDIIGNANENGADDDAPVPIRRTLPPGDVPRSWFDLRTAASAQPIDTFAAVTSAYGPSSWTAPTS